ncbi:MAG TPA: hypothetical protein VFM31_05940 [Nitrososphaeraceae archaeon]|jgi:hypothetical protein|nr:hypothetical protein [Nitrososphaeraceae archaeon]
MKCTSLDTIPEVPKHPKESEQKYSNIYNIEITGDTQILIISMVQISL